jgi:hypothetical protein
VLDLGPYELRHLPCIMLRKFYYLLYLFLINDESRPLTVVCYKGKMLLYFLLIVLSVN